MKLEWYRGASIVLLVVTCLAQPVYGATKCSLKFSLSGWSAIVETASGGGTITCDNGQSARVSIQTKGGGLTFGKSKIADGRGTFSPVGHISEVFGNYAKAEVLECPGLDEGNRFTGAGRHRYRRRCWL